jgi:hypothetical protein
MRKLLTRLGCSFHQVNGFLFKADPEKQQAFAAEHEQDKQTAQTEGWRRYFLDGVHPLYGLEVVFCCWLLVGQRFEVGVGGGRKRLNNTAGDGVRKGEVSLLLCGISKNSWRSRITGEKLRAFWEDLASSSAAEAYDAVCTLAAFPRQVVPLLRKSLAPVPPARPGQVARLLADLGSAQFEARERATEGLERLGELAVPELRRALAKRPDLEVRRRIERILSCTDGKAPPPARLAAIRAVEVLEHVGTPEARALLRELGRGAPEARLTQEAKASLDRLKKRPAARR